VLQWPLRYTSGSAPAKRDVLSTLELVVLAGYRSYAHVTALRGDAVAAQALGMHRVVSEDAVRPELSRIDSQASDQRLRLALLSSVLDALDWRWIGPAATESPPNSLKNQRSRCLKLSG
jgi:hypothetical protein